MFAQIFAGLTTTFIFGAAGIALMKRGKAPRITAILMFIAGCGLVGTWWQGFATKIANALPAPVVGGAAVLFGLGFVLDCWGKQNRAGKTTAIIGFFVPILMVVAPVSLLGVNPGELVHQVKDTTASTNIVTTNYKG